jgi:uncharacterized protein DUF2442
MPGGRPSPGLGSAGSVRDATDGQPSSRRSADSTQLPARQEGDPRVSLAYNHSTQPNFGEHGMSTSPIEARSALAQQVAVIEDALTVDHVDGRTVSVPLSWYPRLAHGTPAERSNWRLIGRGEGVHWPDLDEDISVAALIAGWPSGETQNSLRRWLASRQRAR